MRIICFLTLLFISYTISAQVMPGFSGKTPSNSVCEGLAFASDEDALTKVKEICEAIEVPGSYNVEECSLVDNCKAILNNSGSYS